jgi:tRNA threonylcarbamoyladenosine biosynthesis protein TsaB
LLDQIDAILKTGRLKPADLDAVACMKGPGSFTGLRIAWAAAKGLSLALDIPILSAPTLDCLALPFSMWPACVMPIIDAKKNCFFVALYKGGRRLTEYLDEDAQSLEKRLQSAANEKSPILLTGPGAGLLQAKLTLKISKNCTIDHFIRKGKAVELLDLVCKYNIIDNKEDVFSGPLYLRKSDAELSLHKTNETLVIKK